MLTGMEDVGYFGYLNRCEEVYVVDWAELEDGRIAALTWGDRDSDGTFTMLNTTYVWDPTQPDQPEIMDSTAWKTDGDTVIVWRASQVNGCGSDADRAPYGEDRIVTRLKLRAASDAPLDPP